MINRLNSSFLTTQVLEYVVVYRDIKVGDLSIWNESGFIRYV